MKTVIAKLVEIDRSARELVEQAYDQRRQSEESLAAELEGMEQDYTVRIADRLEKNRQQHEADTQAQIALMEQGFQEKLDQLERRAKEQAPQLEEALFQRCIGGDAP